MRIKSQLLQLKKNMFVQFRKAFTLFAKNFSSDTSRYGIVFASTFADALEKKGILSPSEHQGYCGVGFHVHKGRFVFSRVWDGCMMENIKSFGNKEKFIEWLSHQCDYSMSGDDQDDKDLYEENSFYRNNQRMYRSAMEAFIFKVNTK